MGDLTPAERDEVARARDRRTERVQRITGRQRTVTTASAERLVLEEPGA
ncbi:hypothetical protein [Planomonospora parontospora]|nr:hypothetical protein [Planomonospora parontospora]